jgi:hypothetical protein
MDPLYLLLTAGVFALTVWLVSAFEKIRRQK